MKFSKFLSKVFYAYFALICPFLHSAETSSFGNDMREYLFQHNLSDFSQKSYSEAVSGFFKSFESLSGKKIVLGEKKKVGLKIYTNSGVGHATPKNLVDAIIDELLKRGYTKEDILIVDMERRKLRDAEFLPPLSQLLNGKPDNYKGIMVIDLESNKYYHKDWFYDNPLLPKEFNYLTKDVDFDPEKSKEARKSFLPVPLFLMVDFWINLPVVNDLEGLGVCGALGNMTIWNMSNNERFLKSPANTPIAVAEVASIPELIDSNLFTILTFEQFQYIGGMIYNAACCSTEKVVIMSKNPNVVDYIAFEYINRARAAKGFRPIEPMPPIFDYANQLELGDWNPQKVKLQLVK